MRVAAVERLGLRSVNLVYHLGRIAAFIGEIGMHSVRPPWRFRRLVGEIFDVGVLSLAIVCLSGATVGAVLGLQGVADPRPELQTGRAPVALPRNGARDEFLRATRRFEDDRVILEPVSGQESHMIVRAALADALVHVPRGSGEIPAGAPVRYLALA